MQWKSIHCGYVPEDDPAPPPSSKPAIEPQVDPIKAEQVFTEYVDQLLKRYLRPATWLIPFIELYQLGMTGPSMPTVTVGIRHEKRQNLRTR